MLTALKKKLALYRKNRLVDGLAALSDEDAREVVRFAKKGMHLHTDPKGKRNEARNLSGNIA